jgi:hypothetical protein
LFQFPPVTVRASLPSLVAQSPLASAVLASAVGADTGADLRARELSLLAKMAATWPAVASKMAADASIGRGVAALLAAADALEPRETAALVDLVHAVGPAGPAGHWLSGPGVLDTIHAVLVKTVSAPLRNDLALLFLAAEPAVGTLYTEVSLFWSGCVLCRVSCELINFLLFHPPTQAMVKAWAALAAGAAPTTASRASTAASTASSAAASGKGAVVASHAAYEFHRTMLLLLTRLAARRGPELVKARVPRLLLHAATADTANSGWTPVQAEELRLQALDALALVRLLLLLLCFSVFLFFIFC